MEYSSYRLGSQSVARSRFGLLKFSVTESDWVPGIIVLESPTGYCTVQSTVTLSYLYLWPWAANPGPLRCDGVVVTVLPGNRTSHIITYILICSLTSKHTISSLKRLDYCFPKPNYMRPLENEVRTLARISGSAPPSYYPLF